MAKCRGCGAPVKWVDMLYTGAKMILDQEPEQRVMILEDLPEGTNSNWQPHLAVMVKVYKQHWASCPKAKNFKRKKKPQVEPLPG